MSEITAKGHNGTVTFDGTFVTISRNTVGGRLSQGSGEKRIPIGQISAVQWRAPGLLKNGYLSISLPGATESKSLAEAVKDENSVVVTKQQAGRFLELRQSIDQAIAARYA